MGNSNVVNIEVRALIATDLTLAIQTTGKIVAGQTITFNAHLTDYAGGDLPSELVTFWKKRQDQLQWTQFASSYTNSYGVAVATTTEPTSSASAVNIQYHAEYAGNGVDLEPTNSTVVGTRIYLTTTLTLTITPISGVAPLEVVISGTLKDQTGAICASKSISILVNGSQVTTTTTNVLGVYTVSYTFTTADYYQVQAHFDGTENAFPYLEGCVETTAFPEEEEPPPISLGKVALAVLGVSAVGAAGYAVTRKKKGGV